MTARIRLYVAAVAAMAVISGFVLYTVSPVADAPQLAAAVSFASLGLLAQLLSHRVSKGSRGSIAFIPYLASAVVTSSWVAVAGVTIAAILTEASRKPGLLKATFNSAQVSLGVSASILVYRALGGHSLLSDRELVVVPYAALVFTHFLINSSLVSAAIAISEGASILEMWRRTTAGTLFYDMLASPVAYVFAWVYVEHGATWAAGLAIPLLGIRQIYKTNWELERTHHELLQLMVKAIEARDPYTSGHSQRVANYSKAIARAIGLKARDVKKIEDAALLHDVGKIHEIYAPILMKPGKLTPEEWQVMQTHPIKSEELVKTVSSLKDLLGSIRHHHENWDGTGYPDGIAGEDIPLGARIITLADTIDAMTTDRPYRQALGRVEVEAEIVRLRGQQYDPVICDVLIRGSHIATLLEGPVGKRTPSFTPMLMGNAAVRRAKGSISA